MFLFIYCLALDSPSSNYKKKRTVWTLCKTLLLCSPEKINKFEFGTTWGTVNDDRTFIFGRTIPLTEQNLRKGTLVPYQTRLNQQRRFALYHMSLRGRKKKDASSDRKRGPWWHQSPICRQPRSLNLETGSKRACATLGGVCVWKCAGVWLCVSFDWALFTL